MLPNHELSIYTKTEAVMSFENFVQVGCEEKLKNEFEKLTTERDHEKELLKEAEQEENPKIRRRVESFHTKD